MRSVIILRYGELHLKGSNRGMFEKMLIDNIREKLSMHKCEIKKAAGRYVVSGFDVNEKDEIISKLTKVFGLVSLSEASEIDSSVEGILEFCKGIKVTAKTFKATVKRADKKFPITSDDFAKMVGSVVYDANEGIKVDVHKPECEFAIDIRENGKTFVYTTKIPCAGGMPYGSAGRGLAMLSGGIDSPVSAYMMAKRGLALDAIHFHSFPHTSLEAKEKVISLAKQIRKYMLPFKLYICNFTKIQEAIHMHCRDEYSITIMRRIMLKIGEQLCEKMGLGAIVTGESLGQVASQTMQSITCTNSVLETVPVFRPLIGFDKIDIISMANKIGTYDISILPFEDCCTIFLPDKPVIKPTIKQCLREESLFNFEPLIAEALENMEVIEIN